MVAMVVGQAAGVVVVVRTLVQPVMAVPSSVKATVLPKEVPYWLVTVSVKVVDWP
jgi:hypothetical protein